MSVGISTGAECATPPRYVNHGTPEAAEGAGKPEKPPRFSEADVESLPPSYDNTHRQLKARHIQVRLADIPYPVRR